MKEEELGRAARNILSVEYFNQVIKGLNPSIKVMLLKGEALLDAIDKNEGLRCLVEMDILARREDLSNLKNYLASCGYRFTENIRPSSDVGYINSVMCQKDVKFWPALHVHWHPVNTSFPAYMFAPHIDLEKIWCEAKPLLGYDNVLIMSPHHQLIYLSEHALKHSFERPKDLRDIDMLINRHKAGLNWDRVIADAKDFNLTRAVYYSLYFASNILGTEIPLRALEELKPQKFTFLERRFINSVRKKKQKADSSYAVYLAMNERVPGKIRFVYRTLFPPRTAMGHMQNLPPAKVSFIHYLNRIMRGIQTIGGILP